MRIARLITFLFFISLLGLIWYLVMQSENANSRYKITPRASEQKIASAQNKYQLPRVTLRKLGLVELKACEKRKDCAKPNLVIVTPEKADLTLSVGKLDTRYKSLSEKEGIYLTEEDFALAKKRVESLYTNVPETDLTALYSFFYPAFEISSLPITANQGTARMVFHVDCTQIINAKNGCPSFRLQKVELIIYQENTLIRLSTSGAFDMEQIIFPAKISSGDLRLVKRLCTNLDHLALMRTPSSVGVTPKECADAAKDLSGQIGALSPVQNKYL